jgi:predicted amino acid-binding ACT domain protein
MSDPTPTRQDVVEANIAAVLSEYTKDANIKMISQCVQDISISLAMLVDNSST